MQQPVSGGALHRIEEFAHEHPIPTVCIGLVIVVIIFYLFSGSGDAKPATTVIQQPNTTGDAAAVAAAKIAADTQTANAVTAANAQTALATIAAGVQNSATAAASQAAIANANSASAIAQSHDQAQATISGNTTIASEFLALADVLKNYSNNQTHALETISTTPGGIVKNQPNQQAAIINNAVNQQAYTINNAVNQQAATNQAAIGDYYSFRSDALYAGYPKAGKWRDPLTGTGINSADLFASGATGGSVTAGINTTLADYSAQFDRSVTNAASAVNNKDMNTLVSQLTAQIGNGVIFHAGGAN